MKTEIRQPACDLPNTPEVRIVGKKTCIELEGKKTVKYVFDLNSGVDSTWSAILQSELQNLPPGISQRDLRIEIHGADLHLICFPVNLESKYSVVKAAIERTNKRYPSYREQFLKRNAARKDRRWREKEAIVN